MSARERVLHEVLDAVVADETARAIAAADAAFARDADPWHRALGAFARFLACDYAGAARVADEALTAAVDEEAVQLARGARAFAAAGWGDLPAAGGRADHLADALAESEALATGPASVFTGYLLAEAALATARLDLAGEFVARLPAADPLDHPYAAMVGVMRVRVLVFRGRVAEAAAELDRIPAERPGLLDLLVSATETLVRGNAAERARVRALADRLETAHPEPHSYLGSGCYLLAAFGLVAVGDVRRAARLALLAGGDADLARLAIVDRALAYELLVSAAVAEDDLDAAESWAGRAQSLAASPIANSTVERLNSRVALLRGDPEGAAAAADRAAELARAQGRAVEAAEAEIVGARARIASARTADASSRLEAMVGRTDAAGFRAARVAAARELRAAGRRLRPASGSRWEGLSAREHDVALLVAEGLGNREIAAELHLSEHTVRAHVSRVLAAFGAASRFVVAAHIAELFPEEREVPATALTPRQLAVAELIARGAGNTEIGSELGLSVKTVEKHVAEILRRWQVTSRVGIARRYRAL